MATPTPASRVAVGPVSPRPCSPSALARGDAPAGAYTPAEAFGPELAVDAGGEFLLD